MQDAVLAAAMRLADLLAEENAALTALDLPRAGALLGAKTAALEDFTAALQAATAPRGDSARQVAERLRVLGEANRRLLERAIHVQGRVLASIAKALPKALATAPRYGAGGSLTAAPQMRAFTLSARA